MSALRMVLPGAMVGLWAAFLPGCHWMADLWGDGSQAGREPADLLEAAEDPDWRRQTIVRMSESPEGLEDRWLETYAALARQDPDPSVRCAAVRALARGGNPEYLPALIDALSDPSGQVRWDAAVALDRVRGERAVDPLRERAREDDSADVRAGCARALRHYPQRRVAETLARCLTDSAFKVRYCAHRSLVSLTGRDPGYELEDWQPVIRDENLDLRPPAPERPWWDWLNVTGDRS